MIRAVTLGVAVALLMAGHDRAHAVPITLQQGTATFSQADFSVDEAINGFIPPGQAVTDGWAIDPNEVAQTVAFETAVNVGAPGGTLLTFTLHQLFGNFHTIGRFRLSATTDDRSTFADGLDTGGDVTAAWTVLTPTGATSVNGTTLTVLGDGSVLAGGTNPSTDIYTITATTALVGITGFRLEVLEDASLPFLGPGRQPTNGNFVLSEITVDATPIAPSAAVPEPGTLVMGGIAALMALGYTRRRRRAA